MEDTGRRLRGSARRVQQALRAAGVSLKVVELPESTRTAAEAARAVGCEVGQIAKSLVFRGKQSGRAILIVASGAHRVDEGKVSGKIGEPLQIAPPDFVRAETGFAIGGVPPLGHTKPLATYIDKALLQHEVIWAAAGTPHAVFRLRPEELIAITGGEVIEIA